MAAKTRFKDADMQAVIGWVLRIGVIVSVSVVIIGGMVYLYRHGSEAPNHKNFIQQPPFVQLNGILQGILDFHGRSIIQAGIVLLIATPILRIIFSTISFALEKDRLYVVISLVVLLIIVLSSLSGHIG
jgi:uncharacterized membrane protein